MENKVQDNVNWLINYSLQKPQGLPKIENNKKL